MRLRATAVALCILGTAVLALAGDGTPKHKDKSKPVRHALEQAYAQLEAAIEQNDAEAILAFRHPDFEAIDAEGRTLIVSAIQPPIDAGFSLGIIELNGDDEAVATVRQSFSRMQRMGDKLRKMDTSVTQDETWVRTPEGWRLRLVEHVRDMQWYVDGKRVEPGKPYDPDAPAYAPE